MRRYTSGTEWISGCSDGSIALWSQTKKKPVSAVKGAHGPGASGALGPGCCAAAAAGWVQSVAACPDSDLVVRFAVRAC